ncbi:MAG: FHA domain-containing protein, partial [Kiritimatiellae bacterium]|nr:FHA domain-containing protein [Kiritimatiellia bacterium]
MAKLIFGSGATAQEIPLFETGVTIGRNPSVVNIPIQDGSVSGNHATIRCEGGVWYLIDNNSSNGTFVNGKQISSQALASGDSVTFGNITLQFVDDAAPAQAPVAAPAA